MERIIEDIPRFEVHDNVGAGWEIYQTLPKGFKVEGTWRDHEDKIVVSTWTLLEPRSVLVGCGQWVQFSTKQWNELQQKNANLIGASTDLLRACENMLEEFRQLLATNGLCVPSLGAVEDMQEAVNKANGA